MTNTLKVIVNYNHYENGFEILPYDGSTVSGEIQNEFDTLQDTMMHLNVDNWESNDEHGGSNTAFMVLANNDKFYLQIFYNVD